MAIHWDCKVRNYASAQPGILNGHGSATGRPSASAEYADGPSGHHVEQFSREPGFGCVYTQTQLSHNGMKRISIHLISLNYLVLLLIMLLVVHRVATALSS